MNTKGTGIAAFLIGVGVLAGRVCTADNMRRARLWFRKSSAAGLGVARHGVERIQETAQTLHDKARDLVDETGARVASGLSAGAKALESVERDLKRRPVNS